MQLEQQFAPIELCKRLKELGIAQEGQFSWVYSKYKQTHEFSVIKCEALELLAKANPEDKAWKERVEKGIFSAWGVAELGVMLPSGHDTMYCSGEGWNGYDLDGEHLLVAYKTEAECRAAMLIHLIQIKQITHEDCNKRLQEA